MIIIKTKTDDVFVNNNQMVSLIHDKKKMEVKIKIKENFGQIYTNVIQVRYVDTIPMDYKTNGNELNEALELISSLKADLRKMELQRNYYNRVFRILNRTTENIEYEKNNNNINDSSFRERVSAHIEEFKKSIEKEDKYAKENKIFED